MLLSAVSVLVVAQSSSEIPEGLMNNPVQVRSAAGETTFINIIFRFTGSKVHSSFSKLRYSAHVSGINSFWQRLCTCAKQTT